MHIHKWNYWWDLVRKVRIKECAVCGKTVEKDM